MVISNAALWIIAVSMAIEAVIVVAVLFFIVFILLKIRAEQKGFSERIKRELWMSDLKKIPGLANDILENVGDVTNSIKESVQNANKSFDKAAHIAGEIDSLLQSLLESVENINILVKNSANDLKNSIEKKSSDIYIVTKAVVNVAKNMLRRKNVR